MYMIQWNMIHQAFKKHLFVPPTIIVLHCIIRFKCNKNFTALIIKLSKYHPLKIIRREKVTIYFLQVVCYKDIDLHYKLSEFLSCLFGHKYQHQHQIALFWHIFFLVNELPIFTISTVWAIKGWRFKYTKKRLFILRFLLFIFVQDSNCLQGYIFQNVIICTCNCFVFM